MTREERRAALETWLHEHHEAIRASMVRSRMEGVEPASLIVPARFGSDVIVGSTFMGLQLKTLGYTVVMVE